MKNPKDEIYKWNRGVIQLASKESIWALEGLGSIIVNVLRIFKVHAGLSYLLKLECNIIWNKKNKKISQFC